MTELWEEGEVHQGNLKKDRVHNEMNPVQIHRIVLQWAYQSHTNIIIPPKTTPKALSIEDEKEHPDTRKSP